MLMDSSRPKHLLPTIVLAQFAGTALWFAGNAVIGDLQTAFQLDDRALGHLTAAVQLGFISGTFLFALLSIADRFSPSRVFLVSALLGAAFNWAFFAVAETLTGLLLFRFLTGFFLAGIYPVGMKIAADWHERGLGKALGYLVGALVLGTAFPHLLKGFSQTLPWKTILLLLSILAASGGILLFFLVPDGPYRKKGSRFEWSAIYQIFRYRDFRAAAFGYFGHMWELYTVWTFLPVMMAYYSQLQGQTLNVALWSFLIIASGALACVLGGYASLKWGSNRVAFFFLAISGTCCLLSPLFFWAPPFLFLMALLFWGFSVIGDSPQFSTIVAQTAPPMYVGTALTIVNCLGFALTIGSIQLLNYLQSYWGNNPYLFLCLLPGPILGLRATYRLLSHSA
ncbi:MAG: MFS transporter [Bacteroidota bacterium]